MPFVTFLAVAFVIVPLVVMGLLFMAFIVVAFVFMFGEGKIDGFVIGVDLNIKFVVVIGENVNVRGGGFCEEAAQVVHQQGLVIESRLSFGHRMNLDRCGSVRAQGVEGCLHPRLQTEAVIEEHVCFL